jgi:mannose-1-phosphate guanylyltransferase
MRAMVLAAGVGSRLEPLTNQVPKPMVPVGNRPVLEHIFDLLQRHGITEVYSNLWYLPEQIRDYFGDGSKFGIKLQYLHERELSGDAGGVRACKDFLGKSTSIILMGDLLTDANLTDVICEHKEKKALATIALKQVDDVQHFGIAVTDERGFITGFQEKPQPHEALSNHASTGIYVLEPEVFNHIPESGAYGFGRQLFPSLVAAGLPILGAPIDQYYWSDVGTINQYRLSNFDALEGRVRITLPGTKMPYGYMQENAILSADAIIEGRLMLGQNSKIKSGVRIKGCVLIGDNCLIGEDAELENTIIWSNTNVGRGAVLRDSVLGSRCEVAPGSSQIGVAAVSTELLKMK